MKSLLSACKLLLVYTLFFTPIYLFAADSGGSGAVSLSGLSPQALSPSEGDKFPDASTHDRVSSGLFDLSAEFAQLQLDRLTDYGMYVPFLKRIIIEIDALMRKAPGIPGVRGRSICSIYKDCDSEEHEKRSNFERLVFIVSIKIREEIRSLSDGEAKELAYYAIRFFANEWIIEFREKKAKTETVSSDVVTSSSSGGCCTVM